MTRDPILVSAAEPNSVSFRNGGVENISVSARMGVAAALLVGTINDAEHQSSGSP